MLVSRRTLIILLLLAAAFLLPRAAALRGVQSSASLHFDDMSWHLRNAVRATAGRHADVIRDSEVLARDPSLLYLLRGNTWPSTLYILVSPLVHHLGPLSPWVPLLTNLFFTVLLVVAVWLLGRAVLGPRWAPWAAGLTLLCPPLVASSWYFHLDYPLVAMVTTGLLLLWRTGGFSRPWACLDLAAWSLLGMIIKPSYALYLAGPSLAVLATGLWRGPGRPARLALSAGAALVVAAGAVWLLDMSQELLHQLLLHAGQPLHAMGDPLPTGSARWWLSMPTFAARCFPWPLLLLLLPGLVLAHTRRLPGRPVFLGFLWGTVLLMTLMNNKMERYLHPTYPVLCLLGAWGVVTLVPRRRALALAALTAAFAVTLVVVHLRPTPWLDQEARRREGFMYELRMPSSDQLAGLRRGWVHPDQDMSGLGRCLHQLKLAAPLHRPLLLALVQPDRLGLPHTLADLVYLMAAQAIPDHLVLSSHNGLFDPDHALYRQAPVLLLIHGKRDAPGQQLPRHHEVVRCTFAIGPSADRIPMALTLLKHQK